MCVHQLELQFNSPSNQHTQYDDGFMHAKKKTGMCHKIADTVVTTGAKGCSHGF